jgi:hypothetical protein
MAYRYNGYCLTETLAGIDPPVGAHTFYHAEKRKEGE